MPSGTCPTDLPGTGTLVGPCSPQTTESTPLGPPHPAETSGTRGEDHSSRLHRGADAAHGWHPHVCRTPAAAWMSTAGRGTGPRCLVPPHPPGAVVPRAHRPRAWPLRPASYSAEETGAATSSLPCARSLHHFLPATSPPGQTPMPPPVGRDTLSSSTAPRQAIPLHVHPQTSRCRLHVHPAGTAPTGPLPMQRPRSPPGSALPTLSQASPAAPQNPLLSRPPRTTHCKLPNGRLTWSTCGSHSLVTPAL